MHRYVAACVGMIEAGVAVVWRGCRIHDEALGLVVEPFLGLRFFSVLLFFFFFLVFFFF